MPRSEKLILTGGLSMVVIAILLFWLLAAYLKTFKKTFLYTQVDISIPAENITGISYIDTAFNYKAGDTICVNKILPLSVIADDDPWLFSLDEPKNITDKFPNYRYMTRQAIITKIYPLKVLR